jgi:hypothetical protein
VDLQYLKRGLNIAQIKYHPDLKIRIKNRITLVQKEETEKRHKAKY